MCNSFTSLLALLNGWLEIPPGDLWSLLQLDVCTRVKSYIILLCPPMFGPTTHLLSPCIGGTYINTLSSVWSGK